MKEMYYPELSEMYQKIAAKLQQVCYPIFPRVILLLNFTLKQPFLRGYGGGSNSMIDFSM